MSANHFKKYSSVLYMILDAAIIAVSFLSVSFAFLYGLKNIDSIPYLGMAFYILVHVFLCQFGGQYSHLWQYAGLKDYAKFYVFVLLTGLIEVVLSFVFEPTVISVIMSLYIVLATSNLMMLSRIVIKFVFKNRNPVTVPKVRLAIIGGGFTASSLLNNMETAKLANYEPVCIFDDDEAKQGKSVNGVKIVGPIDEAPRYCAENNITDIIIAIPSASSEIKKKIINKLAADTYHLSIIPSVEDLIENKGKGYWNAVREVRIEDLLGRDVIDIKDETVGAYVRDKVVLVTGGGGSIGSELCRQIAANEPKQLILLDIYENNAYDIQQELIRTYHSKLNLSVEIASVRDIEKIDLIFEKYHPNIIYHAAAHKHVPLMETNPEEAIKNNVFGTYNVAMAADKYHAEKFILISSDKAVNPTNAMGATKRMCEMIVQSMKNVSKTEYAAVRFGNVLGSNGSVVPLFKKQIAAGGPVTVTHKDIIRYFMTIPEAVQLVLITAAKAQSGSVYVLDMGEPVRIDDFARKMINLSGYKPGIDIKIEYTGLRPGEKLFEELLIDSKTSVKTEHDKIFIEQLPSISREEVQEKLNILKKAAFSNNGEKAVNALMKTVSTFNHNNIPNKYTITDLESRPEKSIAETKKVYVTKI